MRVAKSGPSAMGLDEESSSDDEAHSPPTTQPRLIPRSAVSEFEKITVDHYFVKLIIVVVHRDS